MKTFLVAVAIVLSTSTAFATQWTCEAYCSVDNGAQGLVLLVGQGSNPSSAFDRLAGECGEMNYPYLQDPVGYGHLFTTNGDHHEEATIVNSCKMFDKVW
jgi:hypothetical protein